ncbi:MAG: PKD domain-containing protein, partial [Thermoplasmata archaeon]
NELWVVRYNGPGDSTDAGSAIAIDTSGNIYVTGVSKGNETGYDYATIKYSSLSYYEYPEGSSATFTAIANDPGSDDLTFTWNWGDGTPDNVTTYYNDGIGPEPVYDPTINEIKSPWGTYSFNATDTVSHIYGDDGVFTVTLTVEDDDGGISVYKTNITVLNVDPKVTIKSAIMDVEIGLRVAGRKYNNVSMTLYEDGNPIGNVSIERMPGSPNEQMAWIPVSINFSKSYSATVTYTPEDPPNIGANPVWIYIKSQNGSIKKIHHTFNVQQSKKRDSDHWNHVEPWEVDLNAHFIGLLFEITSHITDPGSDDETLTITYGSQVKIVTYLNNPPNPDPYPSPEVKPIDIMVTTTLVYEGPGTVTLVVKDDDNIRLGVGEGTDFLDVG